MSIWQIPHQFWMLKSKWYSSLIPLAAILISFFLIYNYNSDKKQTIANAKHQLILEDFNNKKEDIRNFFRDIYVNTRTISLLPSVRSIKGGNRISVDEDVVAQGRFSAEEHRTVQQIYNNLSAIGASEIYAVVDGFNPEKGEVPFFMYDSLVIESSVVSEGEVELLPDDYPEEKEDEEYDYYLKQLDYFRDKFPAFNVAELENIPIVSSDPVRTCDNTQYLSIAHGDPINARGLLYSLPFYEEALYGAGGDFRGIISTIFRLNVLEAILLDVPFLIITDRDKAKAKKIGFEMSAKKGNFVLVNESRHIFVGDRRAPDLIQQVKKIESIKRNGFYMEKLNIKDDTPWTLYYKYDQEYLDKAVAGKGKILFLSLAIVVVSAILLMVGVFAYERIKENLRELEEAYEKMQSMTLELSLKNEEISKYSSEMEYLAQERSKQLIHADRMVTIGTLSAGVAHEIGNPAAFIGSNLQIFERLWDRSIKASVEKAKDENGDKNLSFALDEMPKMVKAMREGVRRISTIVRNLCDFSRVEETAFEEVSVRECINNAVTFCRFDTSMKHSVDVQVKVAEDIPNIVISKSEIEQVLINLFTNAVHAMEKNKDDVTPTIKISAVRAGDGVVVEIADNGCGIDEKNLKNIFNPFFTTKEVGKGTGLGLSICFGIVEKHRGTIQAASKPGEGTTFTITLPPDPVKEERRGDDNKTTEGIRKEDKNV